MMDGEEAGRRGLLRRLLGMTTLAASPVLSARLPNTDRINTAKPLTDLRNSLTTTPAEFLQTGTGAMVRPINAVLDEIVSAANFAGATVAAKITAAIAAARGRPVFIPSSMGPGEPATYPVGTPIWDMRGANALGAGRKTIWDLQDANGSNVITVLNDMVSPKLSHAGVLAVGRATGLLPNNRNIEGIQADATLVGTVTGGGPGYIVSGSENGGAVNSLGASIGFCWGLHAKATTGKSSTTNVKEVASIRAIGATHSGSGKVTSLYSLIVDDVSGTAANKGAALIKGNTTIGGDLSINRAGVSSASSFLSGANGNFYHVDIGRASPDLRLAAASAANDFLRGTAVGDSMVFNPNNKALFLGANHAPQQKISSIGTQCITGFYPPKETGAAQTESAQFAGSGTPDDAYGKNGDYYFRSDTPGISSQRIYVKTAGVWVGIV